MYLNLVDLKNEAMLFKSQPGNFNGHKEGIGKQLEKWLEKMDDYFNLTHSAKGNKEMMNGFELEKSAKH